jgi:hypothetical protein
MTGIIECQTFNENTWKHIDIGECCTELNTLILVNVVLN